LREAEADGKAGLSDVRIHDLRHSYAGGAPALGEGSPMIGKLLGHSQAQTTARHAHLANDPVIPANLCFDLLAGLQPPLRRRARMRPPGEGRYGGSIH